MESTRRELYTIRGKLYLEMGDDYYNEFKKKYKNYSDWFQKEFESLDRATDTLSIYNNDMFEPDMSLRDFIKKFACDLDWAKDTEYCKVAPPAKEKNRWYDLEESNKQKFISRYPCIGSLPINYGKQKETDEGLIISLNVIYNNERVWLFMVESQNPDLMSKYHALIKKQDGSDEGRFECENMTQPQDNQLSPD